MNPAPISATLLPEAARAAIVRASASVQQLATLSPSMPGIGGLAGDEPVEINNLSYASVPPPCRGTRWPGLTQ